VAYGVLVQLILEGKPRSLLTQVLEFSIEVGLPITLADIGLGELDGDMLNRIAERSTAEGETIHNEPFEVTAEMVSDAIRAADATGSAWKQDHGHHSVAVINPGK
jgi:glycerol dehydrogenase